MTQYISLSSDSLDELCKDTSFIAKAREIGKKETEKIIEPMAFTEFTENFPKSIWVGFGLCDLIVEKSSSEDGIFIKLKNMNEINPEFIYRFLEGSVSATLGKEYMLEYDSKNPEDVLLMPVSSVQSTVKKPETLDQRMASNGAALTSDHNEIFNVFEKLLAEDYVGLCISRSHPDLLRKKHKLENTDLVWLTSQKEKGSLQADRWEFELARTITNFIKDVGDSGVILLDGLEYVMVHNPDDKRDAIFKQVLQWKDYAISNGAVFLLPLKEKAISDKHYAILSTEFEFYDQNKFKSK